jgi:hypothetical protein
MWSGYDFTDLILNENRRGQMKRLITFVSGLSLVLCINGIPVFGQTKAPRTPAQRQEKRVERTEKRTDRLERKDERVDKRDTAEKTDRKATNARDETLSRRIERNEQLRTRVTPLLPPGTSLSQAADGFQSEGQFIAALHASKNLGIPFTDLKAKMTGSNPMTLGEAIKTLKPSANATSEAAKAQTQANTTMK